MFNTRIQRRELPAEYGRLNVRELKVVADRHVHVGAARAALRSPLVLKLPEALVEPPIVCENRASLACGHNFIGGKG